MSDRFKGIIVALEDGLSEEDTDEIGQAIGILKGVAKVTFIADPTLYLDKGTVLFDIRKRLNDAFTAAGL